MPRFKNYAAFLIGILLLHFDVDAQSKLRGLVAIGKDQPLAEATILLLNSKDSSLVKGSLTVIGGRYVFEKVSPGTYLVSASYSGYKQVYSPPIAIIENDDKEIAPLILSEKISSLNEVTVIAKKPLFEQKIDRMVINVANNITFAGSTVLDVLERSPGIVVDRQNNALSINGKDGVVVMINGRINHMPIASLVQMLAAMPSDNVEKVELITTPPANFDAEGNAGYINIVLKRNTQYGTNGSYALTAAYSKGWITNASGNFNHRETKWNLYGNYSFNRTASKQIATFYHAVSNQGKFSENYSQSNRDPAEPVSDLKLGLDYDVKKDLVIGTLVDVYDRGWNMTANNTSSVFTNGLLDTTASVVSKEKHPLNSYDLNLNLQKNYDNGKLAFNVDYMNYRERNPVSYVNSFYGASGSFLYGEEMKTNKGTPVRLWVTTLDLEKKLSNKTNISLGAKTTISNFTNAVQVDRLLQTGWTIDPQLTATYFLNENISAAYSSLDWSITDKTKMKAGLRFEYTNSNLKTATVKNIVDRHYGKLFPSLFLSHTINDDNSLTFSYSRRITRPTFWNLAPFVIFMDPNTFFSGNPGLQPAITDNLNFAYAFKRKIVSVSYSYESEPISNFSPHVDPQTNKETLSAENQDNSRTVNLSLSVPVDITKWWSAQINFNASYIQMNGLYNKEPVVLKRENFFANSVQNFKLPKEFTLSVSAFYSSAGIFGIYKVKPIGSVDLGMQKKLKDKKSAIRLNYGNVFNTIQPNFSVNLPDKNLIASGKIMFTHPSLRFTFTHGFGSEKVKAKRDRPTGSEEEKDRLKM